jgi:hypothetical protein
VHFEDEPLNANIKEWKVNKLSVSALLLARSEACVGRRSRVCAPVRAYALLDTAQISKTKRYQDRSVATDFWQILTDFIAAHPVKKRRLVF